MGNDTLSGSFANKAALAALSQEEFDRLSIGTPMRRIGYHGLRRNACLSLGSTRALQAEPLLEKLTTDPEPQVRDAARWALSRLLGLAPAELVFLKGSTGRPHLDPSQASGLDFSLSHSGCGALLGVSAAPPIGVDIEQIGRRLADPLAVAGQYFAAEECQALQACPPDRRRALFLSYWTLKEASVKARGEGIAGNLERTRFAVDAAGGVRGTSAATEAHRFALFRPDVDFLAAVALGAGERPDRLEHFLCVPGDPPVRAHWPGGLPS